MELPNLVSVDWLYDNITLENLLIFDATIPKVGSTNTDVIEKKVIENSIFFDIKNSFSNLQSLYPNTIPTENQFQQKAQELGVNNDSIVVVYDDLGIYSSARVWWLFKTFGFENIAVLDGGLPAWIGKKYPIQIPTDKLIKKGNFIANYKPERLSLTKDVLETVTIEIDKLVVDARSKERFNALQPEPRKEIRGGHIPNSINIPFTDLLIDGKMKPTEEIKRLFNEATSFQKELIFSCGSGITACVLALAAELINYKKYTIYDGSWTEWGSRKELPIEK